MKNQEIMDITNKEIVIMIRYNLLKHYINTLFTVLFFCNLPLQAQIQSDFIISDSASHPVLDISPNNEFHIGWWEIGNIKYQRYDSVGTPLSDPVKIYSANFFTNTGASPFFTLKSMGSKTFFIWSEDVGFNSYIKSRYLDIKDDTLSPIIQLNDIYYDALRANPDITLINDTTLMVVWAGNGRQTQTKVGIYGQVTTSLLDTIGSNILLSDYTGDNGYPNAPSISNNTNSTYMVVTWIDDRNGNLNIYGRLIEKDGTPYGDSFLISERSDFTYVWSPDVVMNEDGSFMVVYCAETSDDEWNIYLRLFDQYGTPIDSSVQINEGKSNYAAEIRMAANDDGRIIVLWEGNDEQYNNSVIIGQRFFPDGTKIGNNFRISTSPEGKDHMFPSVDIYKGKIFTAWNSEWVGVTTATVWANILDFENPVVGIRTDMGDVPQTFTLSQNYPNPFNSSTNFQVEILKPSNIKITIYNLLGREIAVLKTGRFLPGTYVINWDSRDQLGYPVPSGVYLFKFNINEQSYLRKISLVR